MDEVQHDLQADVEVTHRKVEVVWESLRAQVDEELAPLILALWKVGILTYRSGRDDDSATAYIVFPTFKDAKEFLDLVAEDRPRRRYGNVIGQGDAGDLRFRDTFYGMIMGCGCIGDWVYTVEPCDRGVEWGKVDGRWQGRRVGPADLDFLFRIRFPMSHVPQLVQRIAAAINRSANRRWGY
jgi:hypothetical protein